MEQNILSIISDILETPVTAQTLRKDVPAWDSLMTLRIVMALDEAGIPIPLEKVPQITGAADILAFAAGVLATELLRRQMGPNAGHLHWRQPILLVECGVLVLVSFLPQGGLDPLANMLISFTSAVQIESFRKFHGCACATTMCTGNLRSGTEHLFRHLTVPDSQSAPKAMLYYGLILSFVTGAILSGLFSPWMKGRTVLLACIPLLTAFGLMFRSQRMGKS